MSKCCAHVQIVEFSWCPAQTNLNGVGFGNRKQQLFPTVAFREKWEAPTWKLVGQEHFFTCAKWCIYPKLRGFPSCPVMNRNGCAPHAHSQTVPRSCQPHCCLTRSLFARSVPWLHDFIDLAVEPLMYQVPFYLFNLPVLSLSKQTLETQRF